MLGVVWDYRRLGGRGERRGWEMGLGLEDVGWRWYWRMWDGDENKQKLRRSKRSKRSNPPPLKNIEKEKNPTQTPIPLASPSPRPNTHTKQKPRTKHKKARILKTHTIPNPHTPLIHPFLPPPKKLKTRSTAQSKTLIVGILTKNEKMKNENMNHQRD